jgi:hypothetical protein
MKSTDMALGASPRGLGVVRARGRVRSISGHLLCYFDAGGWVKRWVFFVYEVMAGNGRANDPQSLGWPTTSPSQINEFFALFLMDSSMAVSCLTTWRCYFGVVENNIVELVDLLLVLH